MSPPTAPSTTSAAHEGDPRSGPTMLVAIVGTIVFLAVVVFTIVLFQNVQRREDETKLLAPRPQELADLQFKQLAPLAGYEAIDPQQNVYGIPIERAMELFVARGGQVGKPARAPTTIAVPASAPASTHPTGS